jgi:hypothetical protein
MKKNILAIAFLFLILQGTSFAANRFWVGPGNVWGVASNWGSASGVRDSAGVPLATDDVIFNSSTTANVACVVTAAAVAKSLNFTGWTNSLTITNAITLTMSGPVSLNAGMTWGSSTGILLMNTAAVLTTNETTINCDLAIGSVTITLVGNLGLTGDLRSTAGDSAALTSVTPVTINCTKGINVTRKLICTRVGLLVSGTGTWTGSSTSGRYLKAGITINTPGTITMTTPGYGGGNICWINGTLSWGTTTLYVNENTSICGLDYTIPNITVLVASTVTLNTNLTIANTLSLAVNLVTTGNGSVTASTIINTAASNLTFNKPWSINNLFCGEGVAFTILGNYDQTVSTLDVRSAATLTIPNSRTLTVLSNLCVDGTCFDTTTIKNTSSTTTSKLVYRGSIENLKVHKGTFTYIDATGSSVPIYNLWGSTLTGTTYIYNTSFPTNIVGIIN